MNVSDQSQLYTSVRRLSSVSAVLLRFVLENMQANIPATLSERGERKKRGRIWGNHAQAKET